MLCVETQNEYCLKYLAVVCTRKPNFAKLAYRQLLEKYSYFMKLCKWSIHSTRVHEWTALFSTLGHVHNVGNCRFACVLCWHNCSLSWIQKKPVYVPRFTSSQVLAILYSSQEVHSNRQRYTAVSCCCNGSSPPNSDWLILRSYISPLSLYPFFNLQCFMAISSKSYIWILILLTLFSTVLWSKLKSSLKPSLLKNKKNQLDASYCFIVQ